MVNERKITKYVKVKNKSERELILLTKLRKVLDT